jgi:hypothetical protein
MDFKGPAPSLLNTPEGADEWHNLQTLKGGNIL